MTSEDLKIIGIIVLVFTGGLVLFILLYAIYRNWQHKRNMKGVDAAFDLYLERKIDEEALSKLLDRFL